MHKDAVGNGESILIVDDLLATGGTVAAAVEMVEELGGEILGIAFVVNLPFLGGSKKLSNYNLKWLVSYDSE